MAKKKKVIDGNYLDKIPVRLQFREFGLSGIPRRMMMQEPWMLLLKSMIRITKLRNFIMLNL